ncbi:MAG: methyl-accepting chemotaxis protein [Synergistaceae bacterium]|nr:methyl-accepting chemotaxis protein [Synergistaceae bacterium]
MRNSSFLAREISDSMLTASNIERKSYDMFLSMRAFMYLEDDSDLAEARQNLALAREGMNAAIKQSAVDSRLSGLREFNGVSPILEEYGGNVDEVARLTDRKHKAIEALNRQGETLQKSLDVLSDAVYASLENNAGSGDPQIILFSVKRIKDAEKLYSEVAELRRHYVEALLARDTNALSRLVSYIGQVRDDVKNFGAVTTGPDILAKLDETENCLGRYQEMLKDVVTESVALLKAHDARQTPYRQLNDRTTEVAIASQKQVQDISTRSMEELSATITLLVTGTIVAIVIALLVAFFISRMITGPLHTIIDLAGRASRGDLTVERSDFHYDGRDELGVLVDALFDMIASQKRSVEYILNATTQVSEGAEQLLAISEESNSAMHEIQTSVDGVFTLCESNSAALEECNAGIEEMSAGAMTSAQSSTECAESIAQTAEISGHAIKMVSEAIGEMGTVNFKTQESEQKIADLVESVNQISSFVTVITSIADQTNLLALNAAIEAASAGEAGRGVAVVAEEVRKLAEESGRAAQNVETLIAALQKGAKDSIAVSTESVGIVKTTLVRAEQAQKSLNEALSEMGRANDSVQSIAAVAQEQAASSREIASAIDSSTKATVDMKDSIDHIRKRAEDATQASGDVAQHAEIMSTLAQELRQMMDSFKIQKDETRTPGRPKSPAQAALRA